MSVCVIGAGIIGLSTAVAIQEKQPSPTECSVTIIADKFDRHTTSWGAGGQIVPYSPHGVADHVGKKWSNDSAEHFYRLVFSPEASNTGVNLVGGYFLNSKDCEPPVVLQRALNVRRMEPEDLKRFGVVCKSGFTATTSIVEPPIYLEWLMNKFLSGGGKVVQSHVKSLEDLSGQYNVVVNCTGMGSRTLVNDPLIRPVRGQTMHLKAPWIKNFVRVDATMHLFPFRDSVFLGSVKQDGIDHMTISAEDSEGILKRAQAVYPPLKNATIIWEWVGIRPQRDIIRVEQETITTLEGKQLKVVHNYGHGSYGISLSWGTALYAAELVDTILKRQKHASRL